MWPVTSLCRVCGDFCELERPKLDITAVADPIICGNPFGEFNFGYVERFPHTKFKSVIEGTII